MLKECYTSDESDSFYEKPTRYYQNRREYYGLRTGNTVRKGRINLERKRNYEYLKKWIILYNDDLSIEDAMQIIDANKYIIDDNLEFGIAKNGEDFMNQCSMNKVNESLNYSLNKQSRWKIIDVTKNRFLFCNNYVISTLEKSSLNFKNRGRAIKYSNPKRNIFKTHKYSFSNENHLYKNYYDKEKDDINQLNFEILYEYYTNTAINSLHSYTILLNNQKKESYRKKKMKELKISLKKFQGKNCKLKNFELRKNLNNCLPVSNTHANKTQEDKINGNEDYDEIFIELPKKNIIESLFNDFKLENIQVFNEYSIKPIILLLDCSKSLKKCLVNKGLEDNQINRFRLFIDLEFSELIDNDKLKIKLKFITNLEHFSMTKLNIKKNIKMKNFQKYYKYIKQKFEKFIYFLDNRTINIKLTKNNSRNLNDTILIRKDVNKFLSNWLLSFLDKKQENFIKFNEINEKTNEFINNIFHLNNFNEIISKIKNLNKNHFTYSKKNEKCLLCNKITLNGFGLNCDHWFCINCLLLRNNLNNCPIKNCNENVPLTIQTKLKNNNFNYFFSYLNKKLINFCIFCRNIKCNRIIFNGNCFFNRMMILECECGEFFCLNCKYDAHWPIDCKENMKFLSVVKQFEDDDNQSSINNDNRLIKAIKYYESYKNFRFKVVKCKIKCITYRWRSTSKNPCYNKRRTAFDSDAQYFSLETLQSSFIILYRTDYIICYSFLLLTTKRYNVHLEDIIQRIELTRNEVKELIKCLEDMMDFNQTIIKRLNSLSKLLQDSLNKLVNQILIIS